jgi:type I restriction enzyme, R subunit
MDKIYESEVEEHSIELLKQLGYQYLTGGEIAPEMEKAERENFSEVVLIGRLRAAVERINPSLPAGLLDQAVKKVLALSFGGVVENNEAFHKMLVDGVRVEHLKNGAMKGEDVYLIDYNNLKNNDFLVSNQFVVQNGEINKRPDVIIFVNGLPLVVIELKNPADENATIKKAFTQIQNYKTAIPNLFNYNSVLVISDGLEAKAGSLTSSLPRFSAWKTKDGKKEDSKLVPQIETLVKGMLNKEVLLDLIKYFTVFTKEKEEDSVTGQISIKTAKIIAAYHQYYAVKKAVESTLRATAEMEMKVGESPAVYGLPSVENQPKGDRRAGVVWHTQGSGKSFSMVFFSGQIVQSLDNPTIVVITDRNDLDDQLFDTFSSCRGLLRQDPVQAESRGHLKQILNTQGGGVIFTTIQKFSPTDGEENFELLSKRKNIVVIADEAHRTQYGFRGKIKITKDENGVEEASQISYGFAKYLRDALPNASFIGFTGTPIEKDDRSTKEVFGNYIDVYDVSQAVADGATVKIYYESRLVKVHLKDEDAKMLDEEVEAITEDEEATSSEKAKAKWAQLESVIGHRERIKSVAADVVNHFESRKSVLDGKAMIVVMSRRIAVELYEEIIKLRPDWHSGERNHGKLKVIMTSASSDPESWQIHHTTKDQRKELARRFKDESDELELVIVRDMWLTGFDAPCMKTMYMDKPMRGHNLMQAIARVNRVYEDIDGGLIVDYVGIATDLKKALAVYTENGGVGSPVFEQSEAIAKMLEKFEVVSNLFGKYDYKKYFATDTSGKMRIILEAEDYVLTLENGKERYVKEVELLSKAYALSNPSQEAMDIKSDVAFFQAVKARLVKFEGRGTGKSSEEIETAIRQIVDKAVVTEGVVDIFEAAGIEKPNISILSEDFLAEVKGMKHKNLAIELLKKILNDEVKFLSRRNLIRSRKFSEMLAQSIKKYQNQLLTSAEIINELIKIAKEVREDKERGAEMNMTDYEMAFYDALADNDSAKDVMSFDKLRELAMVLVDKIKENTNIDWTIRESAQAKLRVIIKRMLKKYGYPPDMQKLATETVLQQAKLFADEIINS